MASNYHYHFPLKESKLLGKMADSRLGTGNVQVEPGTSCDPRPQELYQGILESCKKTQQPG